MDVTYTVALKAPHGTRAQFKETAHNGWQYIDDINDWLSSQLDADRWSGWMLYNDQPPEGAAMLEGGHCKGIVAWTEEKIGWMIHSVPKWPDSFGKGSVSKLRPGECVYGQSFVWLTIPVHLKGDILDHIRLMQSHVYEDTESQRRLRQRTPTADKMLQVLKLSENVFHIAKHSKWGKDLFEDGIVPVFGGTWITETWSRPGQLPTGRVGRILSVRWASPHSSSPIAYTEEDDHSKWAITRKLRDRCSYVGDINAMESQFHRGGGGVVIEDSSLWKALKSLVTKETVV